MSADSAILAGRAAAEARMTDTCKITKPGEGTGPFNQETGQYDKPARVTVYEGICRIPRRAGVLTTGEASEAGSVAWQVGEWPLDLPVDGSENVAPGMIVEYVSAALDSSLTGRKFTITQPSRQSAATARHFRMKEVVGT